MASPFQSAETSAAGRVAVLTLPPGLNPPVELPE